LSSGEEHAAKAKTQAAIKVRAPTRLNEVQPFWIENLMISSTPRQKWMNHTPQHAGIPRRSAKSRRWRHAVSPFGLFPEFQ
jgi:hypothetical protein